MLPADQRLAVHCMCVLGAMSMRLLTVMILSYQHNTWTHLPTPWLSATTLLHPERPVSDVHVKAVLAAHDTGHKALCPVSGVRREMSIQQRKVGRHSMTSGEDSEV